jgi:hypothetical protein
MTTRRRVHFRSWWIPLLCLAVTSVWYISTFICCQDFDHRWVRTTMVSPSPIIHFTIMNTPIWKTQFIARIHLYTQYDVSTIQSHRSPRPLRSPSVFVSRTNFRLLVCVCQSTNSRITEPPRLKENRFWSQGWRFLKMHDLGHSDLSLPYDETEPTYSILRNQPLTCNH